MTNDIVDRLRAAGKDNLYYRGLYNQAAYEIERLRNTLKIIRDSGEGPWVCETADAALENREPDYD